MQSKRGRAKNVVCSFVMLLSLVITLVYADIALRNVVGQKKMNIKACVHMHRKDDTLKCTIQNCRVLLWADSAAGLGPARTTVDVNAALL